jgi:hypothetical protein
MKQRTARYSYYRTSFPTAVKCGNSAAATQRERIEREDNSESLQDTRPQVGAFFFFLSISFFFLSLRLMLSFHDNSIHI